MTGFLLFLLVALPILFLFLLQKQRKNEKRLLPPGPPGLPFIGNMHQLDNSALHLCLWQLSKMYGPLMSLRLGCVPSLVVSSARMAKEVLKTHDQTFAGRPPLVGLQTLTYNGSDVAFTQYGEYWREMRKICVLQLFSSKRVQSFQSIREDEVSRLIQKISTFAASSELVNLSDMIISLANNVICRIAFSRRYDDEACEARKFHELLNEASAMLGGFFISDYFPLMGWADKLTGMCSRLHKNFKELDSFYQEIIDGHLDPKRAEPEQEDIIDVLLRLKKDRSFMTDLTFDQIKAVLLDMFFGGTDTTAATMIWAMTELMKNPRAMKRVQEEVRNLMGKKNLINEEDLQKFPYLKSVVKETLRLHPVTPAITRQTIQKCTIDGYEIQAQTRVFVNLWAIGRDPDFWERPEEFLPERFLDSPLDFKGQDFGLIPFGAGRRGCPGLNLAALTVELTLANLLYSFNWELPAGTKEEDINTDILPGLAMNKKFPLRLLARKYGMGKDAEVCLS